jgi:hypothetical protein
MKSYYEYAHIDDEHETRYDVHDCPFCGSKDTDLYQTQVRCERCDAHGPDVSNDFWHMAITLWNDLPRKKGDELKQLRLHWSNLMRRIRRAEKIAQKATEKWRQEQNAPKEKQQREYRQWAAEREAWLSSPVNKDTAQ